MADYIAADYVGGGENKLYGGVYGDADDDFGYGGAQPVGNSAPFVQIHAQKQQQQATNTLARYYWNERFQAVLERPVFTAENAKQKGSEIRELLHRFQEAAIPVCEKIVEEFNVPDDKKTIRPCNVGGIAGGKKFMHRNLFIKIADEQTSLSLYGGLHFANKAAAHELKGINSLLSVANTSMLHFPLLALVQVRGHRLIVVCKLPINGSTLISGSCDAGRTIKQHAEFDGLLKEATKTLNLAPHLVLEKASDIRKTVYGPVDLEGHLGLDMRYYVCDLARLMPPVLPVPGIPGIHLFRLFRPEFVAKNPCPLSSDACSHFGLIDKAKLNKDIKDATDRLMREIDEFSSRAESWINDMEAFKKVFHERGINLRFMGAVFERLTDARHRKLLLVEMTARAAKNELFDNLRLLNPVDEAVRNVLGEFFGKRSSEYWSGKGLALFSRFFEFHRLPSYNANAAALVKPHLESLIKCQFRVVEDRKTVFERCTKLAGVELALSLVDLNEDDPFSKIPIGEIKVQPRVKVFEFSESSMTEPKSFEEAEKAYLHMIEKDAQNSRHLLNLALHYAFHGRDNQSSMYFDLAIQTANQLNQPLTASYAKERFVDLLYLFNPGKAEEMLQELLATREAMAQDSLNELCLTKEIAACVKLFCGAPRAAIALCDQVLALRNNESQSVKTKILKGKALYADSQARAALDLLLPFAEQASSMPLQCAGELWDILGLIQAAEGEFVASINCFEEALKAKTRCFGAMTLAVATSYSRMGVCLVKKRDLDGAQEAFSKAKAICASISHGEKSRFFRAVLGINECCLMQARGLAFLDTFAESMLYLSKFPHIESALRLGPQEMVTHEDFSLFSATYSASQFDVELIPAEILDLLYGAGVSKEMLQGDQALEIFTCLLETIEEEAKKRPLPSAAASTLTQSAAVAYGAYAQQGDEYEEEDEGVAPSDQSSSSESDVVPPPAPIVKPMIKPISKPIVDDEVPERASLQADDLDEFVVSLDQASTTVAQSEVDGPVQGEKADAFSYIEAGGEEVQLGGLEESALSDKRRGRAKLSSSSSSSSKKSQEPEKKSGFFGSLFRSRKTSSEAAPAAPQAPKLQKEEMKLESPKVQPMKPAIVKLGKKEEAPQSSRLSSSAGRGGQSAALPASKSQSQALAQPLRPARDESDSFDPSFSSADAGPSPPPPVPMVGAGAPPPPPPAGAAGPPPPSGRFSSSGSAPRPAPITAPRPAPITLPTVPTVTVPISAPVQQQQQLSKKKVLLEKKSKEKAKPSRARKASESSLEVQKPVRLAAEMGNDLQGMVSGMSDDAKKKAQEALRERLKGFAKK